MNDRLEAWADRIDGLSLRERALLLVAAVAILFGVVNTLLLTPVARAQQDRTRQIRAIQSRLTVQSQQARNLAAPGHGASNGPRQQELASLHRQLTALDGQLQRRLGTLIRPAQAPAVLKTLLRRERGLQLISLDAHREAPLPPPAASPDAHHDRLAGAGIARYTFTLHFKGSYLATLNYLQALEQLRWQLFWQRIDLKADRHTGTQVTLEVYTLGQADAERFP